MNIQRAVIVAFLAVGSWLILVFPNALLAQPILGVFGPTPPPHHGQVAKPLAPELKRFLQAYAGKDIDEASKKDTRVVAVSMPLTSGGQQLLVYISGGYWSGSGGCSFLVLAPIGKTFKIVGDVQTWAPIRRLPEVHYGHPDLAVWVQGGGVFPGYPARMRYDGRTYRHDGYIIDGPRIRGEVKGEMLITGNESSAPLYP